MQMIYLGADGLMVAMLGCVLSVLSLMHKARPRLGARVASVLSVVVGLQAGLYTLAVVTGVIGIRAGVAP